MEVFTTLGISEEEVRDGLGGGVRDGLYGSSFGRRAAVAAATLCVWSRTRTW